MKVKNVYRMVHTMGKTQPGGVRGGTENSEKECILWKEKAEERAPARSEMQWQRPDFPGGTDRKKMKSVWKISQAAVCAEKEKMSV